MMSKARETLKQNHYMRTVRFHFTKTHRLAAYTHAER
jgi:hypothetical protein